MAMECKICARDDREKIEKMMLSGKSHLKIAKQFDGINNQNVRNHLPHLSSELVKQEEARSMMHGKELIQGLQDLMGRTERILTNAENTDKPFISLQAIREMRAGYEFMVKLRLHLAETQNRDDQREKDKQVKIIEDNLSKQELEHLVYLLDKMAGRADPHDSPYGYSGDDDTDDEEDTTTERVRFDFEDDTDDSTDDDNRPMRRKKKIVDTIEDDLEEDKPKAVNTTRRLRPDDMFKGAVDGSVTIL